MVSPHLRADPMRNKRAIRELVAPEIREWPGATFTIDNSRPHPRILLRYKNQSRFVVTASTGSDRRGPLNMLARVKRELAGLGATRAH